MTETRDYVRSRGPWLVLLLILPLVAGAFAYSRLRERPREYRSTLEFAIPEGFAEGVTGIGLYVANFTEVIRSGAVVDRVGDATGVDPGDVRDGLDVERAGQSTRLQVGFTGTREEVTEPVVRAAAAEALQALAASSLDAAEQEVAVVERAYELARAEIDAFGAETGFVQPSEEYTALQGELRNLERQLRNAEADLDVPEADATRVGIAAVTERRDVLGATLPRYQRLQDNLNDTLSTRRDANRRLVDAQTVVAQAREPQLLTDVRSETLSQRQLLIQGVGLAVVVAFLLTLGLLLLPDLLRRPARPSGAPSRTPSRAPAPERRQGVPGWDGLGRDELERDGFEPRTPAGQGGRRDG